MRTLFRLACQLAQLRNQAVLRPKEVSALLNFAQETGACPRTWNELNSLIADLYSVEENGNLERRKDRLKRVDWGTLWAENALNEAFFEKGVRVTWPGRADYPINLLSLESVPSPLFYWGDAKWEGEESAPICVVGTRRPSDYGRRLAREVGQALAQLGVTLVSGLAYGIDSLCQRASIEEGGRNVAVLASGFASIYPREHEGLAREIRRSGFLVSEQAPSTVAKRSFFPIRNRIMSGLSEAVVVLEAMQRSGTWSTVEQAIEQDKTIWIAPGSLYNPCSYGCNRLIEQGLSPFLSINDLVCRTRQLAEQRGLVLRRESTLGSLGGQKKEMPSFVREGESTMTSLRKALETGGKTAEDLSNLLHRDLNLLYLDLAQAELEGWLTFERGRYALL